MSGRQNQYNNLLSLLHKYSHRRCGIQQIHCHLLLTKPLFNHIISLLVLWNSIIKHYALSRFPRDALSLFKHLGSQRSPFPFDSITYSYLIKACANMKRTDMGSQLHSLSTKVGFDCNVHVQTALVNMYADSRYLVEAKKVFDEMPDRNMVTWNVLLTGFVKWGEIAAARAIFDAMPENNVVSWTGLIDGYTRVNRFHEALHLFRKMVAHKGIRPTEVTLLAVFPSIWNVGSLEFCQTIHGYGEKSGLNVFDVRVVNCLIDAYSRSGSIGSAWQIFEEVDDERKNLVSWTSMISAFAMHGMAGEASDCYKKMESKGVVPNSITFLSVMSGCSHGGLVVEGLEYYRKMVDDYGIMPEIKHYGALIDMLGRAGRLKEAEKIALGVAMDNVVVWRTLLGACSFHGDVEMGERVTRRIMEIERRYGGDYVLMSNIFSAAGRFADSERVRKMMDARNASKLAGITLSTCRDFLIVESDL
ncbi:pentatricopeptide repeat-containing protein, mitochondrial [Salvia divinorum]|uniref:Pentatricopeptide repeat-containing protein, mitochondrial n=1 Tax=Salvia divinorum TaxID=28513 RepID=A0ABD1HD35_SALDI